MMVELFPASMYSENTSVVHAVFLEARLASNVCVKCCAAGGPLPSANAWAAVLCSARQRWQWQGHVDLHPVHHGCTVTPSNDVTHSINGYTIRIS